MTKYAVNYDNGASDAGTFKQRFDTEAEAQAWADDWANERNLMDLGLTPEQVDERGGEGCYTAEVIELEEDITEADVHNLIARALENLPGVTVSQDGTPEDPSLLLEFPSGQGFFIHAREDE